MRRKTLLGALLLLVPASAPLYPQTNPAFPDGVAVGDVSHSRAVVWTRATGRTSLTCQLSLSQDFDPLYQERTIEVTGDTGFAAKLTASGLLADRTYYYRFTDGVTWSDTGVFRTPPVPWVSQSVRFAFSGDSDGTHVDGVPAVNNYEVLDAVLADEPAFFIYLGDIVYTDSEHRGDRGRATTLEEYRGAYHESRQIPALRKLQRSMATIPVWDDHEVGDDWNPTTVDWGRLTNGRRAFLEQEPISPPVGVVDDTCVDRPMFRYFRWGQDVDFFVLDERSCRSADASESCRSESGVDFAPLLPPLFRSLGGLEGPPPPGCIEALSEAERTLLGQTQKWQLKNYLLYSTAKFKFVINEVAISEYFVLPFDRWEGYAAERAEILNFIREHQIENVIFLTADSHANVIADVSVDRFNDPEPIAVEFITGPIATNTLEDEVTRFTGIEPDSLNQFVGFLGMECWDLNVFGYGLVDVDAGAGTVTVSLKDEHGDVIVSKGDPEVPCTKVITAR